MKNVEVDGLTIGDDHPPRVMGVVNVSKQSPYEPSVFNNPSDAIEYIQTDIIDEGADIVDIGLESANKRFDVLPPDKELERLETAVEIVQNIDDDIIFSIETRYSEVANKALSRGFDMVNDICGFADPDMPVICEDYNVPVVKMASPPDLERPGALSSVDAIYEALKRGGFTSKTIVDPAFGGWSQDKTIEDDQETFRRLREFQALNRPILISINRKNFLGEIVDRPTEERLPCSIAATSMAVERGVNIVRTHDVKETVDAVQIGDALQSDRLRTGYITELNVTSPDEVSRYVEQFDVNNVNQDIAIGRVYEITGISSELYKTVSSYSDRENILIVGDRSRMVLGGSIDSIQSILETIQTEIGDLGKLEIIYDHCKKH
ncbi:MAG: dihydropteroate synthase [Halobacteriaceae archaeon]